MQRNLQVETAIKIPLRQKSPNSILTRNWQKLIGQSTSLLHLHMNATVIKNSETSPRSCLLMSARKLNENLTKRRHRVNDVQSTADGKQNQIQKIFCCAVHQLTFTNLSPLFNRFIDGGTRDRYRHGRSVQLHLHEHSPLTTGIPDVHVADRRQRKSEAEPPPANSIYTLAARLSRAKIPMSEVFIGGWPGRSRESTQFVGNSSENLVKAVSLFHRGVHGGNCYKLLLVISTPRSFSAMFWRETQVLR